MSEMKTWSDGFAVGFLVAVIVVVISAVAFIPGTIASDHCKKLGHNSYRFDGAVIICVDVTQQDAKP